MMDDEDNIRTVDLTSAEVVEIQFGVEGQVWVNVDGICRFRAYRVKEIRIEDNRGGTKIVIK